MMWRICCWCPLSAWFRLVTIVCNWLSPPPLSSAPRAASVSAMDGALEVSDSGTTDPPVR